MMNVKRYKAKTISGLGKKDVGPTSVCELQG